MPFLNFLAELGPKFAEFELNLADLCRPFFPELNHKKTGLDYADEQLDTLLWKYSPLQKIFKIISVNVMEISMAMNGNINVC